MTYPKCKAPSNILQAVLVSGNKRVKHGRVELTVSQKPTCEWNKSPRLPTQLEIVVCCTPSYCKDQSIGYNVEYPHNNLNCRCMSIFRWDDEKCSSDIY